MKFNKFWEDLNNKILFKAFIFICPFKWYCYVKPTHEIIYSKQSRVANRHKLNTMSSNMKIPCPFLVWRRKASCPYGTHRIMYQNIPNWHRFHTRNCDEVEAKVSFLISIYSSQLFYSILGYHFIFSNLSAECWISFIFVCFQYLISNCSWINFSFNCTIVFI